MNSEVRRAALKMDEQGSTLLIIAGSMVALLAMSALAIDLVTFYAVRTEAQRAADSAALAGAQMFLVSGCMTVSGGCQAGGSQETLATQRAIDVGNKNLIAGAAANIQGSDITFNYLSSGEEPQITVVAARDIGHSNAMPTIFGRVLGMSTVNISATATAEAFNPSGTGVPIGSTCLKPWILPNCDSGHTNFPTLNPNCAGVDPFINPTTGVIVNPGNWAAGVIGEQLVIKPGSPSLAPAPSQFYPVDLPPSPTQPSLCPSCAASGGGGGSLYSQNISCCNENQFVCGPVPVNFETGNMQGPTEHGVECLISQSNTGSGQDILVSPTPSNSGTLSITGGSANPNTSVQGATGLTDSNSMVTVPLYDGSNLCPGKSCGPSVTIIGFLQVFVNSVDTPGKNQGSVHVTVLNVAGCGSSGATGGTSTTVSSNGSFVPIRLIHQ